MCHASTGVYVDTSVLVSYIFVSEQSHRESRRILEQFASEKRYKLYTSSYALVELCNTVCRKIIGEKKPTLIEPLQYYIESVCSEEKHEDGCKFFLSAVIKFLKKRLNIDFIDSEELYKLLPSRIISSSTDLNRLKIPRIFDEAIALSPKLKIRIKDLLHIVYAYMLSNKYNIKYFLTRDVEDFEGIKDLVKQLLQIDIVFVR